MDLPADINVPTWVHSYSTTFQYRYSGLTFTQPCAQENIFIYTYVCVRTQLRTEIKVRNN